jgi:sugar transferase (PEP-CTERM/EpsH1 system associated)
MTRVPLRPDGVSRHPAPGGPSRALFLASRTPHRRNDGWAIRTWHLLEALSHCVDHLEVAFFGTEADLRDARQALAGIARAVHAVPPPPAYTPLSLLKGLALPEPFPVHNLWSPAMADLVRGLSRDVPFDAVQIEDVCMAQYLRFVARNGASPARAPVAVLDMHNVDSQLMDRYARHESGVFKALYARLTTAKLAAAERKVCEAFDAVLVCSEQDADTLRGHCAPRRLQVVPNGVDCLAFTWDGVVSRARSLVFTGTLDYHANVSGLRWFLAEVYPRIRARLPDVTFEMVGRSPAPALVEAAKDLPGVSLVGAVPDVRPYVRRAGVVVVPLLVGGGTRLKILEAFAMGKPVVSTSLGCEGIAVRQGRDIEIADAPEAFAAAVVALLGDDARRESLSRGGLATVAAYDWQRVAARVEALYADLDIRRHGDGQGERRP